MNDNFILNAFESNNSIFDWFNNKLKINIFSRIIFILILPIIFFIMIMYIVLIFPIKYVIYGD